MLLFFIILCTTEDKLKSNSKVSITNIRMYINSLTLKKLLLAFIIVGSIVFYLIISGIKSFLSIYEYTALSILILLHGYWLFVRLKSKYNIIPIIVSLLIIILNMYYQQNQVFQDIFIIATVTWLGPFITSFKVFTSKVFIVFSCVWFFYDIFYIWISTGYQIVSSTTDFTGLPLSMGISNASIGLADLFYVSLLISILIKIKYKIIAVCLILISYFSLIYYVYNINFIKVFPLLVLWVPCGLIALLVQYIEEKNTLKC